VMLVVGGPFFPVTFFFAPSSLFFKSAQRPFPRSLKNFFSLDPSLLASLVKPLSSSLPRCFFFLSHPLPSPDSFSVQGWTLLLLGKIFSLLEELQFFVVLPYRRRSFSQSPLFSQPFLSVVKDFVKKFLFPLWRRVLSCNNSRAPFLRPFSLLPPPPRSSESALFLFPEQLSSWAPFV